MELLHQRAGAVIFMLAFAVLYLPAGCAKGPAGAEARHPFPQHVAYAPGSLRPSHRTQAQQDEDVRGAYDRWKANYLATAGMTARGETRFRVKKARDSGAPSVSEGMGYGMVAVALMAGHDAAAQSRFDGLWRYFDAHRSTREPRLMDWHVPADESPEPGEDNSAFDGDADIALALLLADRQWGSGGTVDYRAEAENVLAGMMASEVGPTSHWPMLGDWAQAGSEKYNEYTPRSSDFMPAHFRVFARASGDATWNEVITACQNAVSAFQSGVSPVTGLLPDFLVPVSAGDHALRPAPPSFLEGAWDGAYYYNAGRVPWRLGTDALLHRDATSASQARKIAEWAAGAAHDDPQAIKPGYLLDGSPIPNGDYFSTFYAAPLGVAAMVAGQQTWLNAIYDAVRDQEQGYYADTVTLLCLIVMSGNYWDPVFLDAAT